MNAGQVPNFLVVKVSNTDCMNSICIKVLLLTIIANKCDNLSHYNYSKCFM